MPFPRNRRGLLSRPTVKEVWAYRDAVDRSLKEFLATDKADDPQVQRVIELGLQHEQQHQELMLTDIKHVLSCNPLFPKYRDSSNSPVRSPSSTTTPKEPADRREPDMVSFEGGAKRIGFSGDGFCFDNEEPSFEHLLTDYQLGKRLITNAEYLQFISARGYERPELWLSMGWSTVLQENWKAPLYWVEQPDGWSEFTLDGLRPLDLEQPVCHVSYFEADAFARWSGCRLPTEFEWEHAARKLPLTGNFSESLRFHPAHPGAVAEDRGQANSSLQQMFGDAWEWTASQYTAYPGYQPPAGALGEYNGKFMCNQFVLRGGSCVTSQSHIRSSYRNFFPPQTRWQFTGIRLAK